MAQDSLIPLDEFTTEEWSFLSPDEVARIEESALLAFEGMRKQWLEGAAPEAEIDPGIMNWMALYEVVLEQRPVEEKSRWRKAALIAWEAWPGERWPRSKADLAKYLGLRSSRVFYTWKTKDRTMGEQIDALWRSLMSDEVRAVDRASLNVAKEESYRNTQERRLFYQRQGVMAEDNTLRVKHELDPSAMTAEELNQWIKDADVIEGECQPTDDQAAFLEPGNSSERDGIDDA